MLTRWYYGRILFAITYLFFIVLWLSGVRYLGIAFYLYCTHHSQNIEELGLGLIQSGISVLGIIFLLLYIYLDDEFKD